MNRRSFVQLLTASTASTSLLAGTPAHASLTDRPVDRERIRRVFDGMTTRQKAAQLILAYPQLNKSGPVDMGGVLFVGRMLEDREKAAALVASSKRRAKVPPFFAVDMEGGSFNRMSNHPDLQGLPSARGMARMSDSEVQEWGRRVGSAMAALGLNMNLAPVFDVASSGHMYTNERSFSADPEVVAAKATAFARGLSIAGVAAIGKHYPGYGSVSGDSDHHIVHSKIDRVSLDGDKAVFNRAKGILAGVMMSNVAYDNVGPSPAILTASLIDEAHSHGWITVTDDLSIGVLANFVGGDSADVLRGALMAGNDLLLTTAPPDWDKGLDYVGILTRYAESDETAANKLKGACLRVLALKDRLGMLDGM